MTVCTDRDLWEQPDGSVTTKDGFSARMTVRGAARGFLVFVTTPWGEKLASSGDSQGAAIHRICELITEARQDPPETV